VRTVRFVLALIALAGAPALAMNGAYVDPAVGLGYSPLGRPLYVEIETPLPFTPFGNDLGLHLGVHLFGEPQFGFNAIASPKLLLIPSLFSAVPLSLTVAADLEIGSHEGILVGGFHIGAILGVSFGDFGIEGLTASAGLMPGVYAGRFDVAVIWSVRYRLEPVSIELGGNKRSPLLLGIRVNLD
jgi:hypothetical protein